MGFDVTQILGFLGPYWSYGSISTLYDYDVRMGMGSVFTAFVLLCGSFCTPALPQAMHNGMVGVSMHFKVSD